MLYRTNRAACFVALITLALSSLAKANVVTLTFEGLEDKEAINSFYGGGSGGFGSTGGPNYGITFTAGSLAIIDLADGGSGSFSNNPSGDTIAVYLSQPSDTMNVAGGFDTGFAFYYAASLTGGVDVYSGLGGTGTLLAHLNLAVTPNPYNQWIADGVSFIGTAHSVVFSGTPGFIGFDNLTLGSATPVNAVPLPSAASCGAALFAVLAAASLLRKQVQL